MDDAALFTRLAKDPASLTVAELTTLRHACPYSPLPAMALLQYHATELPAEDVDALKVHVAIVCGDRKALFDLLGERHEEFAAMYPPQPPEEHTTTENAIDTFFANYGVADPAETALLEKMIFNPVPDYGEMLLREEGMDDTGSQMSPAPMHAKVEHEAATKEKVEKPSAGKATERKVVAPPEDSLLGESLAKIFIKQGRYERAYEIISNLSLNYPKKSIYFADQLRFLQKLIKIKQAAGSDKH